MDAGGQIGGCPALLVHHPDLDRMARQGQQVLHGVEQPIGEGGLVRPVHLGFDDIDRARRAVAEPAQTFDVVNGDQAGHNRIHDPLGRLRSVRQTNGRGRHQMPDVAHEQQAAPLQDHRRPVRRGPLAIRLQSAGQGLAALLERRRQIAAHQTQPVAIGLGLVGRIDGGDGIIQIDDGRKGRFQHHIRQTRRIAAPHRMAAVDHQFDVQPVVDQQDRGGRAGLARKADELSRIPQGRRQRAVDHRPAGDIRMRSLRQRRRLVQKGLGPRHNPRAARRVIAAAGRQVAQSIRAVKRVIQAAPPRIGGVQQKAGVQHRHDQLRAGHARDLGVHAFSPDRERRRLLD